MNVTAATHKALTRHTLIMQILNELNENLKDYMKINRTIRTYSEEHANLPSDKRCGSEGDKHKRDDRREENDG